MNACAFMSNRTRQFMSVLSVKHEVIETPPSSSPAPEHDDIIFDHVTSLPAPDVS